MMDQVIIALLVGVFVLLLVLLRSVRAARREQAERDRQLDVIFEDSTVLSDCVTKIGRHLSSLERQLQQVIDQQERLGLREGSVDREYDLAIRMLSSGESVERIMAECGLVRSEVELIQRLYGDGDKRKVVNGVR